MLAFTASECMGGLSGFVVGSAYVLFGVTTITYDFVMQSLTAVMMENGSLLQNVLEAANEQWRDELEDQMERTINEEVERRVKALAINDE